MKNRLATLLMILAGALPVGAQPSDETAKRFHVFPQLADGGGWRSVLLVTNVAESESSCTLAVHGQLNAGRFASAADFQTGDATAEFSLPPAGSLIWPTRDETDLATGYATLDCTEPVVAQVLYASRDPSGATTGMATVFSSQAGAVFQFPVLSPETPVAFAIANDTDTDASCRLVLGGSSSDAVAVPSKTNVARFLHDVVALPEGFTSGSATVSCDRLVSVIGLHVDGAVFTTLPPVVLSTTSVSPTPKFDGRWEGAMILTRATLPSDWQVGIFRSCTGLIDCNGDYLGITADLTQDGSTVTGDVLIATEENDRDYDSLIAVHGEVSSDGTLRLTSVEEVSFRQRDTPIELQVFLESWELRADTPGVMTGTGTFHFTSDEIPGTVVTEWCMAPVHLAARFQDYPADRLQLQPCIGWGGGGKTARSFGPPDETAKRFHVFPQLADGGGWQSILLVTNAAESESSCTLAVHGQLNAGRFASAADFQTGDATAEFSLPPAGSLIWSTRDETDLATGYATLDCTASVAAQVLYASRDSSGATTGMATVFSSQAGAVFQFPVLAPDTPLAFAVANDTDTGASCDIVLEDPDRRSLGEAALAVPSKSNLAQFLTEAIPLPEGFTKGSATVSCDRQVSVIGLLVDGAVFTTLPPAVLSTTPKRTDTDPAAGKMYWTDPTRHKIHRANLDGSGAEDLIASGLDATNLALDLRGGKMYWTDPGTGKIRRANLDGSGVEDLVPSQWPNHYNQPTDLALDLGAGKMYWTSSYEPSIHRANLDGSEVETLVTVGLSRPLTLALDLRAGKMYWANHDTNRGTVTIHRANLDGSGMETLIDDDSPHIGVAIDMALDPGAGKMYWANLYDIGRTVTIHRANLDGSGMETLIDDGSYPDSPQKIVLDGDRSHVALDPVAGKMYWADPTTHKIWRANLDGSGIEDLIEVPYPAGLAMDPGAGKMYWTMKGWWFEPNASVVARANLDGSGAEDLLRYGTRLPGQLELDLGAGKMYWTDVEQPALYRANLDGSGIEDLIEVRDLVGLALDPGGGKMYLSTRDRIWRANLDGSEMEDLEILGVYPGTAPALDPRAGKMYWGSGMSVHRANLDGSGPEIFIERPDYVGSLALDLESGKLYWTNSDGFIEQVNLDGSGMTPFLDSAVDVDGDGNSDLFLDPVALALDPAAGKMYWIDDNDGISDLGLGIWRINLDGSGLEDLLVDEEHRYYPFRGLALDPGGN